MENITFINKIILRNFRIHQYLCLETGGNNVAIIGNNGSGKTSVIEAISLFSAGKSLRGASLYEMDMNESGQKFYPFGVAIELQKADSLHKIKIDRSLKDDYSSTKSNKNLKKIIEIDGKRTQNQLDLLKYCSTIWLTPEFEYQFYHDSSARRSFFDKLICDVTQSFVQTLKDYESLLKERIARIIEYGTQNSVLNSIEKSLSKYSVKIYNARRAIVESINSYQDLFISNGFIRCKIDLTYPEEHDSISSTLESEEDTLKKFHESRKADAQNGRSNFGAHRLDFRLTYVQKNMADKMCSSGEKKSLLISLLIMSANFLNAEKGFMPIVLLDDIYSHLDETRQQFLIEQLLATKAQIWYTNATPQNLEVLGKTTQVIYL